MLQQRPTLAVTPPDREAENQAKLNIRMDNLIENYLSSRYPRLTHEEYGRLVAVLQERDHEPHQRN